MTTPKNGTPNGSLEHLDYSESEVGIDTLFWVKIYKNIIQCFVYYHFFQLRKAYNRQTEEIKNLKNQLANSEKRREELEIEVKRLQLLAS